MADLTIEDYLLGFVVGCLLLMMVFWGIHFAAELSHRHGQRQPRPAAPPDWSSISDYIELSSAAGQALRLAPDAFLDGPFRRFLELASNPADHPRGRARIMEFARAAIERYCESCPQRGIDAGEFRERARAMAAERFASPDLHPDYMLEVLDGISNHNWRGRREDAAAEAG